MAVHSQKRVFMKKFTNQDAAVLGAFLNRHKIVIDGGTYNDFTLREALYQFGKKNIMQKWAARRAYVPTQVMADRHNNLIIK